MKTKYIITLLMALVLAYLFYRIMKPFFIPIFWAVVLSVLLYPYYAWILKRITKNKTIASAIACATIILFIIIPMAALGTLVAEEVLQVYRWAEGSLNHDGGTANLAQKTRALEYLESLKAFLGRYVDIGSIDAFSILADALKEGLSFTASGLGGLIKGFGSVMLNIFLAFFSMFYLFKDGERLLLLMEDLLPISAGLKQEITGKTRQVIFVTIVGGVLIGALQAMLGSVAFWFLGLHSPILWGFVMFLLSFLPGIGTAIVWGPAALYLVITGSYVQGISLFIWGAVLIGLADNVLRPMALSSRTSIHPLLLFFSILGGVGAFGIIGIIAGPLIVSVVLSGIEVYRMHILESEKIIA